MCSLSLTPALMSLVDLEGGGRSGDIPISLFNNQVQN